MKRAITVLTVALLLGGAIPAGARPSGGAGVEQGALAAWIEMKGDKGTFIAADGFTFVDDAGAHWMGGVAKGTCERTRTPSWTRSRARVRSEHVRRSAPSVSGSGSGSTTIRGMAGTWMRTPVCAQE